MIPFKYQQRMPSKGWDIVPGISGVIDTQNAYRYIERNYHDPPVSRVGERQAEIRKWKCGAVLTYHTNTTIWGSLKSFLPWQYRFMIANDIINVIQCKIYVQLPSIQCFCTKNQHFFIPEVDIWHMCTIVLIQFHQPRQAAVLHHVTL